jgi:hypothetical protein
MGTFVRLSLVGTFAQTPKCNLITSALLCGRAEEHKLKLAWVQLQDTSFCSMTLKAGLYTECNLLEI